MKNHRIIFFVILFLVPMSQISLDLYSPSLPKVMQGLHTNESTVQQSISLFLLTLGIGQFIYGPLSDSMGRKNTLLIGMLTFCISSIFCALSTNIYFFLFCRILQGLSCSSIAVLSKVIAVDLYKDADLLKASAWIGIIWGLSPILG